MIIGEFLVTLLSHDNVKYMAAIDHSFFYTFYNLSYHSRIGDFLIKFFGDYFFYITLLAVAYFVYKSRKDTLRQIKLYILTLFLAFVVSSIIRFFFHRPRPFLAFSLQHLIDNSAYSFPSMHTILIFALATTVYFFNKKISYFLYISGLLIGLARIAGGVHYPSDIAGGTILGITTSIALYLFCKIFNPKWLKIS